MADVFRGRFAPESRVGGDRSAGDRRLPDPRDISPHPIRTVGTQVRTHPIAQPLPLLQVNTFEDMGCRGRRERPLLM